MRFTKVRALAWRFAAAVPWTIWAPVVVLGAAMVARRPIPAVRQWQRNFEIVTGRPASIADTERGLRSWARNAVQSLQLGRWSPRRISTQVLISPEDRARLLGQAADPGAVIALPHSGSWDMAGAWACLHNMPVSTVAEELGAEEFRVFVQARERLGFRVYGHRSPSALAELTRDSHQGRLVCLMADRDFSRRGVAVTWHFAGAEHEATMPPGPAQIALRTGASLLGLACHYEAEQMRMVVSTPIRPLNPQAPKREQVASMTQQLCDFFAEQISAHPHDWHMLQPFFTEAPV